MKILDLGLEDRLTSKVGLLSGGQRQALTLLMASLVKPKLLLLDEHTAALDPKTAAKVLDTTEKIVQRDHLTTLMITHNMKDAIAHGNRLIMMYGDHIILDISGEEKKPHRGAAAGAVLQGQRQRVRQRPGIAVLISIQHFPTLWACSGRNDYRTRSLSWETNCSWRTRNR